MEQSFSLFCTVLAFPHLIETFHKPVFIYSLQTVSQQKSHTNNEIFAEALGETPFQDTLESAFVSIGWFPQWICDSNPHSLFLVVAPQIWARKRLKTWVHSPTRYKVNSSRFNDSKNDLPVCIHAVQVSSKPVFVSTWIRIMEWLCQY